MFFQVLHDCGALRVLFPEIDALFGVPAPAKWHPEIDTGIHTLMTLSMAAMLSPQVDVRFATLCHDLGKGLTPPELLAASSRPWTSGCEISGTTMSASARTK